MRLPVLFQGMSLSVVLGVLCTSPHAVAEMLSVSALRDGTLYESGTGSLANGAGQYIFAGRNNQSPSGLVRRGLIQFDLAGALPAGAEIVSARLVLNLSQFNGGPASVSLHRSLTPWTTGASDPSGNEGSGSLPTSQDATWIHSSFGEGGSLWHTAGGDFVAVASASALTTGLGLCTWSSDELLADVRTFALNPSMNFGWFLIGPEDAVGVTRRFDSSESASAGGVVPRLEIEWVAVPAPGALVAFGAWTVMGRRGRERRRAS